VMSFDRLNEEISAYQLALFRPSGYVQDECKPLDEKRQVMNFTQPQREFFLIGMMKVNFLKRLESSINSFVITMGRTVEKIKALEERIERYQRHQAANHEVDLGAIELAD